MQFVLLYHSIAEHEARVLLVSSLAGASLATRSHALLIPLLNGKAVEDAAWKDVKHFISC